MGLRVCRARRPEKKGASNSALEAPDGVHSAAFLALIPNLTMEWTYSPVGVLALSQIAPCVGPWGCGAGALFAEGLWHWCGLLLRTNGLCGGGRRVPPMAQRQTCRKHRLLHACAGALTLLSGSSWLQSKVPPTCWSSAQAEPKSWAFAWFHQVLGTTTLQTCRRKTAHSTTFGCSSRPASLVGQISFGFGTWSRDALCRRQLTCPMASYTHVGFRCVAA